MKVLFLTNVPSPYRVDFFNILSNLCELTVIYEKKYSSERDEKWKSRALNTYKTVYLKGISTGVDKALSLEVIHYLKRSYDVVVLCGISSPTEIIAIEYCKMFKKVYYIESDGGIAKTGRGLKERIKKIIVSGAKGYFSTCHRHDDYYITYGASPNRLYRYPFTSVREKDLRTSIPNCAEKNAIRKQLSIRENIVILSVGQFIYRKGFDILIRAAVNLPEFAIYIVGGEPTEEYVNLVYELHIKNIHFVDFKTKEELKNYYDAADLFVLPTREDIWGLVINEAMSRGLPVITTDNCNAGLEMIRENENGFIVPSDDVEMLTSAIRTFFSSNTQKMAESALETAKEYTLEKMAHRHLQVFNE